MGCRSTVFGRDPWINTIIGGVAGSVTTKSALVSLINGTSVSDLLTTAMVKRFEIVGSDVNAHISSDYNIGKSSFLNNTSVTFYNDLSNRAKLLDQEAFRNSYVSNVKLNGVSLARAYCLANTKIVNLTLNGLITAEGQCFRDNTLMKTFIAPNMTTCAANQSIVNATSMELIDWRGLRNYGSPSMPTNSGNESGFLNLKTGCKIKLNVFMKTANAGAPHNAFIYAKNSRGAIVEFYNDDGSYHSTL